MPKTDTVESLFKAYAEQYGTLSTSVLIRRLVEEFAVPIPEAIRRVSDARVKLGLPEIDEYDVGFHLNRPSMIRALGRAKEEFTVDGSDPRWDAPPTKAPVSIQLAVSVILQAINDYGELAWRRTNQDFVRVAPRVLSELQEAERFLFAPRGAWAKSRAVWLEVAGWDEKYASRRLEKWVQEMEADAWRAYEVVRKGPRKNKETPQP